MRYWLIRLNGTGIQLDRSKSTLHVVAKRLPRIAAGDVLVFLDSDRRFSSKASVAKVERPEFPRNDEPRVLTVHLAELSAFDDPTYVEDLKFSLRIVRNLHAPLRHFARAFRLLPSEDFSTIATGEIFVARSVYYELANSIPPTLRAQFEAEELLRRVEVPPWQLRFPSVNGFDSYRSRLERLLAFLDARVLGEGALLQQIALELQEMGLGFNKYSHELRDEDERSGDDLQTQVRAFEQLNEALAATTTDTPTEGPFRVRLLSEIANPNRLPHEEAFEKSFATTA